MWKAAEPRLPGRGPGARADVWHRGSKTGFLHSCCLTASSWVRAPGRGLKSESLTHCPYLEVPELPGALSSRVGWLLFQQQLRVCARGTRGFGSVAAETPPGALQASRAVGSLGNHDILPQMWEMGRGEELPVQQQMCRAQQLPVLSQGCRNNCVMQTSRTGWDLPAQLKSKTSGLWEFQEVDLP